LCCATNHRDCRREAQTPNRDVCAKQNGSSYSLKNKICEITKMKFARNLSII
jgi:hypothetical protein